MTSNRYSDCEWLLVRDWNMPPRNGREGYTLGKLYFERDADHICETLEDQDRRLEEGLQQIGGPAAMPLGRYQLTLYRSMRYGLVPMFNAVPTYKYCTLHAQPAEQMLGCVAVGMDRSLDGVSRSKEALAMVVNELQRRTGQDRRVFITIERV